MTAAAIVHPAGIATPLLSGGYAIDIGATFPLIVPDRDAAWRELRARLAARTPAKT